MHPTLQRAAQRARARHQLKTATAILEKARSNAHHDPTLDAKKQEELDRLIKELKSLQD
jgi:hypothetical protein